MKRREALQAKDEKRARRTLYAWDFLVWVQNLTRQGTLRFRIAGTEEFREKRRWPHRPVPHCASWRRWHIS
jgi:serine/threonine-protein kinase HipA